MAMARCGGLALVKVVDNALPDGAGELHGVFVFVEVGGVFGVGEVSHLGDDGRNVGLVAGIEPVTAALAAVCSEHDSAGNSVVGHAALRVVEDIAGHGLSHDLGHAGADLIAVEGPFVKDEPFFGIAVVVEEYDGTGLLVEGIVGAQHAYCDAVRMVSGAVDGCGVGRFDVVNPGLLCRCCQFGVGRNISAIADEAGVAGSFDDFLNFACVAVPELGFFDGAALRAVGGTGSLTAARGLEVVTDVEYDDFGVVGYLLHLLLLAGAEEEGGDGCGCEKEAFHNGECERENGWRLQGEFALCPAGFGPDFGIGCRQGFAAARGALNVALHDEEWLVYVFDGAFVLSYGDRERG